MRRRKRRALYSFRCACGCTDSLSVMWAEEPQHLVLYADMIAVRRLEANR